MSCYFPNPEVYFQVKANSLGKPLGRRSDLLGRGTRLYSQSPSSLLVIWMLGVSVQSGSLIIRSQNTCRYKPQFLKLILPLIKVNRMAEYCCTSYALHNFRDAICVLVIAASWWFWPSLCSNHLTYFTFVSEIRQSASYWYPTKFNICILGIKFPYLWHKGAKMDNLYWSLLNKMSMNLIIL